VGNAQRRRGAILTVEATNTFGGRQALERVSLFCANGSAAQLATK
jgi:hypothetical protein